MSLINTLTHLVTRPLNKTNKILAIARYVRWQVGSRLVPGDVIFNWIRNSKIIAYPGETGVTGNIYCGLHEFSDMAFLLHVLRRDDLFIDVGANSGSYTILASSVIGAKVYCFEPIPSTYLRLVNNIRVNNLEGERVVALNIALGDSSGEIDFSSDQDCMNHVIADGETTEYKTTVRVSTLNEEVKKPPFLIKIDVEGYETSVLKGAQNILKNNELCGVIMELNGSGKRYGYDESLILSMMTDCGFEAYSYNPIDRKFIPLNGKNFTEGNTIFIRNMERVLERIIIAPKIEIHGVSI